MKKIGNRKYSLLILLLLFSLVSFLKAFTLDTGTGQKKSYSSPVPSSTANYKINTAGLSFEYNEKKPTDSKVQFAFGFDIRKANIEIESVKVYVAIPGKGEKLLVSSVMPKNQKSRSAYKKGQYEVSMTTQTGDFSRVSDLSIGGEEYYWAGRSEFIANKDPNILTSRKAKSYGYLFKFVIKGKGIAEEVIYQPAVLKIELPGAQNI